MSIKKLINGINFNGKYSSFLVLNRVLRSADVIVFIYVPFDQNTHTIAAVASPVTHAFGSGNCTITYIHHWFFFRVFSD